MNLHGRPSAMHASSYNKPTLTQHASVRFQKNTLLSANPCIVCAL